MHKNKSEETDARRVRKQDKDDKQDETEKETQKHEWSNEKWPKMKRWDLKRLYITRRTSLLFFNLLNYVIDHAILTVRSKIILYMD